MTDRDTTTRTRARAPGVGGVFHRMAVRDRVLRPDSERTTVATTKCTKGGCRLDGGRRMPGAGSSRRSPRKAPLGQSVFQPYWIKLAVRNDRGGSRKRRHHSKPDPRLDPTRPFRTWSVRRNGRRSIRVTLTPMTSSSVRSKPVGMVRTACVPARTCLTNCPGAISLLVDPIPL